MSAVKGSAPNIAHAKAWLEDAAAQLADFANDEDVEARASEMRDVRATLLDVANRAPLPVAHGAVVVMDESAITAYHEAVQMIARAQRWCEGTDLSFEVTQGDEGIRIVNRRREQVAQMELSLYRSLVHLSTVAQDYDGPCHVFRDSEGSFFWRHTNGEPPYHGGIIFHASHDAGERLPVGTWSIHT
jgi:hypothetical protein